MFEGAGCSCKVCAPREIHLNEDARTQVMTSIGVAGKITVRVGLHQ